MTSDDYTRQIADLILQGGQIQAQRAQIPGKGRIIATSLAQLANFIPQVEQMRAQRQAQQMALQDRAQQQQLHGLQIQSEQGKLTDQATARKRQGDVSRAIAHAGGLEKALDSGALDAIDPDLAMEGRTKLATQKKSAIDLATAQAEAAGRLFGGANAGNWEKVRPMLAPIFGSGATEETLPTTYPGDDFVKLHQAQALSVQDQLAEAQKNIDNELAKQKETREAKQAETAATTATTNAARMEAAQTETARHNKAMEARPVAGAGGATGGAGQLTPEGVDLAATQFRVTGTMPAMGMGRTPERFAVINRAAEQVKTLGQSPAAAIQKQYATKADAKSLNTLQTLSATAEAAENKAVGQIQIISGLSGQVPRTQIPLLNTAILSGKINILGDPKAQQLANAIQTFANEYGKIIEGSTGSVSGASDSSRAAARKLVDASMNPTQLDGVLKLMQREMDLTIAGYGAAINHVTERMGGAPVTPQAVEPPPGAGISYQDYLKAKGQK